MAFTDKSDLKIFSWVSFDEWKLVFQQVYSTDIAERKKGYETLLVWKARTPILPAGIACTLELLDVDLIDKDWSEKIDKAEVPIQYENYLCSLFSMAIIRCLNHICHMEKMKECSMYQKCRMMNIPDWIVNIRHDVSHGHELPSLSSLRNASETLFTWVKKEYWAAALEIHKRKIRERMQINEDGKTETYVDAVELWIATGLYIKAGYEFVDEIPNDDLKKSLIKLGSIENEDDDVSSESSDNESSEDSDKMTLTRVQTAILFQLTKLLNQKSTYRQRHIIYETLFQNEIFLPNSECLQIFTEEHISELPENFLTFWRKFILYLQEKKLLTALFIRLHEIVHDENMNKLKRKTASFWMTTLIRATVKQNKARTIAFFLDYILDAKDKKLNKKLYNKRIESHLATNDELKDVLSLNYLGDVIDCLKDEEFLKELIVETNEYSIRYVIYVLDLITNLKEVQRKEILEIVEIVTGDWSKKESSFDCTSYNIDDLLEEMNEAEEIIEEMEDLSDLTERNSDWKLAEENVRLKDSPIGILPWQTSLNRITNSTAVAAVEIVLNDTKSFSSKMLDESQKSTSGQINWEKVIRPKRVNKRNHNGASNHKTKVSKKMKKQRH